MSNKLRVPHLAINTKKLNETIAFYEALDFNEVGRDFSESSNRLRVVMESEIFILELFDRGEHKYSSATQSDSEGFYHIAFPVSSLRLYYDRLEELGVEFEREYTHRPSGHYMCFAKDPNGLVVELISENE